MPRIDVHLTPEDLLRRIWTFGLQNQPPYARYVRLLEDGRIAGFSPENVNERRWRIRDGRLIILDLWDRATTEFGEVHLDDVGRMTLVGPFRTPPVGVPHVLQEIPSPDALAPAPGAVSLERRGPGPPRRNLVLLRANEHSLHPQWRREMVEDDRTWDLLVSFYGKTENFDNPDFSEYRVLQNKQYKYGAVYDLFYEGSPLWSYDYVMMPDDDIMMSWRDLNEIFAICREFNLQLAQPALDVSGYVIHAITARQWPYILRFTSFVEGMTPLFSREALRICAPSFQGAVSGFGLDNTWPKLLGDPRAGVAVIDKVPVLHTRPQAQGGNYDFGRAMQEGDTVQRRYDSHARHLEYGGVLAQPLNRSNGW